MIFLVCLFEPLEEKLIYLYLLFNIVSLLTPWNYYIVWKMLKRGSQRRFKPSTYNVWPVLSHLSIEESRQNGLLSYPSQKINFLSFSRLPWPQSMYAQNVSPLVFPGNSRLAPSTFFPHLFVHIFSGLHYFLQFFYFKWFFY